MDEACRLSSEHLCHGPTHTCGGPCLIKRIAPQAVAQGDRGDGGEVIAGHLICVFKRRKGARSPQKRELTAQAVRAKGQAQ
jgi:hypothetical protein